MTLRRLSTIGLVLLWFAAYAATHVPAEKLPENLPSDKTLHLVGFFGLSAALLIRSRIHRRSLHRRILLVAVIFPLYALFDELTQPLVNRYFAWGDIFADILGANIALALDALIVLFTPSRFKTASAE